MPGGQLSFFIYQQLGGERGFGDFWLRLGLPVLAGLIVGYCVMPANWQKHAVKLAVGTIAVCSLGMASWGCSMGDGGAPPPSLSEMRHLAAATALATTSDPQPKVSSPFGQRRHAQLVLTGTDI